MERELDAARDDADESLRIGFFSESFHPVRNGVATSMLTLTAELRALGHHVVVFAPAHQEQRQDEKLVLRFPSFVTVFNRGYPLAYPFVPRISLAPYFDRLRLDVVHTHTPFVLGLTGANLSLPRGIPVISTFHTLYSQYTHYVPFLPDSVAHGLLEFYLPWYYNRCAELICPSNLAMRTLREMGVERPIEVIPTGAPIPDVDRSRRACRETRGRYELPPAAPMLLYAGRLAREKRVDRLIETFCRVRCEVPDACLVVVGDGPQRPELEAQADTTGGCIRFLGALQRQELDRLYATADLFCFPSPSETQGLVIAEARAAGLPCVVVDAGGAPETVADGVDGFRVPADNPEEFAARAVLLLKNEALRTRMSKAAVRRANDFTPVRMAERVVEVYRRASAHPPRADEDHGRMLDVDADWEAVREAVNRHARVNAGRFR